MNRIRVGVLRGGPSSEYDISLKTGSTVLGHLDDEKYRARDILIDKNADWFINGAPTSPAKLHSHIDVAFNALHGHYGEDGQVQRELERYSIPYTGSGVSSSASAMHKGSAKKVFQTLGIRTPSHETITNGMHNLHDEVLRVFRALPGPYIVKPVSGGSSVGIMRANSFGELIDAVAEVFDEHNTALVEQYVDGVEATCGVIDAFRDSEHYALPPVEIVPSEEHAFFNYKAKYDGSTNEVCPATFSREIKEKLQDAASRIHAGMRLRHYSRSDFIVTPRGIYALEVNTLPGLTEESLLPKSLAAVGCTLNEFLDHLIGLAQQGK